jgi:hypothetical protein
MLRKGVPLWVFISTLLAVISIAFAMVIKTQWDIQSGFQVHGDELKVYETDGVTECHNIDWGCLEQGGSGCHDIIANNTGDHFLNLKMNATLDGSVGIVSWNYSGSPLNPEKSELIRLTLDVSDTTPRGISNFTISIYGWRST